MEIASWWSKETVAIVTGANKGIGFALVKRLAELGLTVILTARDTARGLKAVELLKSEGLNVHSFCLDVSDPNSIKTFVSWFQEAFGVVDILVNNNAVVSVIRTNFYGPKVLTEALLSLLRRSSMAGRILNISSRPGLLNLIPQYLICDSYICINSDNLNIILLILNL
ncbi:hypothetical protein Pfo_003603 [Paulownia fortunei]|nr:hypothetical protein Pfo_003603 [Paulownia fortunei]